jgi:hypothetical protein
LNDCQRKKLIHARCCRMTNGFFPATAMPDADWWQVIVA